MFKYKPKDAKVEAYVWMDRKDYFSDENMVTQLENATKHPRVYHHVAEAPDGHVGYGVPIGSIVALENAVAPYMVGLDIYCGMLACKTNLTLEMLNEKLLKVIFNQIMRDVPVGFSHQENVNKWGDKAQEIIMRFDTMERIGEYSIEEALMETAMQLGTLGGNNHFCELQVDEEGCIWIMIHSGSRNLGKKIADLHHKVAVDFCISNNIELPHSDLAFLPADTLAAKKYLDDISFCSAFSFENRECILKDVLYALERTLQVSVKILAHYNIHHNFVALEEHFGNKVWVHRKGATLAARDEIGIIPGSMGTFSYIVEGLGNPLSYMSCSHGAGRIMGRGEATRNLTKDQCDKDMKGVVFGGWKPMSRRGKKKSKFDRMLDFGEAPASYKDIDEVLKLEEDLVKPIVKLKPIMVVKG